MRLPYCPDCPDHEPCYFGASCEAVRKANGLNPKGNTIMSKNTNAVTPADVAAMAEEKNATVPAQATPEVTTDSETPDLTVIDGGKKSLKERLSSLAVKVKANKNAFIAVGAVAAVAAVAVVKFVKQQAEEVILESVGSDDEVAEDTADESAA
jgi:hypothetical protein